MISFTLSIDEETFDKIRDIEVESKKNKQQIIRQLMQYGFAYIAKEQADKEIKDGRL